MMKIALPLVGASLALASFTARSEAPAPLTVASLAPPSSETLLFRAFEQGVQIYGCAAGASGPQWVFKAPEAELLGDEGNRLGKHYAGPTWESIDGSKVLGRVVASADAGDPTAIPQLLLKAESHAGDGVFAGVRSIQRLQTAGGRAPKRACDANDLGRSARVPYRAAYYFYGDAGAAGVY